MSRLALAALTLLFAAPALAQERPAEEDLFGSPAEPAAAPAAGAPAEPLPAAQTDGHGRLTEDALFGEGAAPGSATTGPKEIVPEDPLRIGGQFYLRAATTTSTEAPAAKWGFSVPTLVDGYMDARPNDRVRGFLLARMFYDPTVSESDAPYASGKQLSLALDQLWLRFDILRTFFVTAGRQHVKWGTGHFWNPTDFLHGVRRDPLAPFDQRVGTTMLKLQVPWEKYGWNLYAVGIFEDTVPDGTLGRVGGALRAEVVVGPAEVGAEAVLQRGHKPRLGADLSAGVGPFDVYAEASLRKGWETPLWRFAEGPGAPAGLVEPRDADGYNVQATGGLSWSLNYMDVNVLTFGAEYFYNSVGYDDKRLYPYLIAQDAFTPFYLGEHYLGVYGMLMGPASLHNLSLVLSNVGNLSDRSFVARVDVSVIVLTHLRLEAYTAFHYGHKGGEFRFTMEVPATATTPAFGVNTPLAEFGLGLRVNI